MYFLSSTFKAGLGSRLIFFQLRLLIFFQAAPPPHLFQAAPAPVPRGQKYEAPCGSAFRSRYRSGIFFAAPAPVQAPVFLERLLLRLLVFSQSAPNPRSQKQPASAPHLTSKTQTTADDKDEKVILLKYIRKSFFTTHENSDHKHSQ